MNLSARISSSTDESDGHRAGVQCRAEYPTPLAFQSAPPACQPVCHAGLETFSIQLLSINKGKVDREESFGSVSGSLAAGRFIRRADAKKANDAQSNYGNAVRCWGH